MMLSVQEESRLLDNFCQEKMTLEIGSALQNMTHWGGRNPISSAKDSVFYCFDSSVNRDNFLLNSHIL